MSPIISPSPPSPPEAAPAQDLLTPPQLPSCGGEMEQIGRRNSLHKAELISEIEKEPSLLPALPKRRDVQSAPQASNNNATHSLVEIMILTSEKILEIHQLIISNFGGTDGVLCQGTIDYLVDQVNAQQDLFRQAAIALHIVADRHTFLDGNKRSAFQIAELILSSEGYFITTKEEEIIEVLLKIASYQCHVDEVRKWLEKNTERQ